MFKLLKSIINSFLDPFDVRGAGFPVGNPKLYSSLLSEVYNCIDGESIVKMEHKISEEYDKPFNLTVFEYRTLRKVIQSKRKHLDMDKTNLEEDFWTQRGLFL